MEAQLQLALAAHNAGRLDEAEALYREILNWRPARTCGKSAVILRTTGRLAEAEDAAREALRHEPGNPFVRHTLGMILLQKGDYAEGWALNEARRQIFDRPRPTGDIPEWAGESLAGKRVLVVTEEGFGDQIMLSRFLPLLVREAAEVSYASTKATLRLFASLPLKVFYPSRWEDVRADVWLSLLSVPTYLGAGPEDAPSPCLRGPPVQRAGGTGLMLAGAADNPNHARRAPSPEVAQAIRELGEFVDLDPAKSGARDFLDTAQILAGLDRVITIDTSVAHLAGALGKPVWILAPRPAVDWYTRWNSDRTPWYPSARVLRQSAPGDWSRVVEALRTSLRQPPPQ